MPKLSETMRGIFRDHVGMVKAKAKQKQMERKAKQADYAQGRDAAFRAGLEKKRKGESSGEQQRAFREALERHRKKGIMARTKKATSARRK